MVFIRSAGFLTGLLQSMEGWQFWLLIAIVLMVIEGVTVMLLSVWFAVGALGAMVAALLGASMAIQILVFVVLSALTFGIGWRFRDRIFIGPRRRTPTNADRIIGQPAEVVTPLDAVEGSGLVRVRGQTWSAETADGSDLPLGTPARVVAIRGVKAIVEAVPADDPPRPDPDAGNSGGKP